MRYIKFKYYYGDGSNIFSRIFSIDQVMNGYPIEEICDSPLRRGYRIIGVCQYTGLKDKNGLEVYERDIVLHDLYGIGFIEYLKPLAAFKFVLRGYRKNFFYDIDPENIKVIGSTIENPELLEE